MNKFGLNKTKAIAIVRDLKKRLKDSNIPVDQVLLFGSMAADRVTEWSDVDVAVVYKPFKKTRLAERRAIRRSRSRFDVPMDIICLQVHDLDNPYSPLVQEIKTNGIAV